MTSTNSKINFGYAAIGPRRGDDPELARAGARVVMAVRNVAKGEEVARSLGPVRGEVEVRALDVADLTSIRAFAASWEGPVDVLINNAGIMQVPLGYTADGLELQMATNYFGPFALSSAMLPHITDRVVSLSSQLHRIGRVRLDDLNWRTRKYDDLGAYAGSKLAIALFAAELQRRLQAAGSPVRSIIAHPGIARTALASHAGGLTGRINHLGSLLNDVDTGALSTLYAATMDIPGRLVRRTRRPGEYQGTSEGTAAFSHGARRTVGARTVGADQHRRRKHPRLRPLTRKGRVRGNLHRAPPHRGRHLGLDIAGQGWRGAMGR